MHYLDLTIKEIHEALVAKKVTPLELTLESLKRAEAEELFLYAKEFIRPNQ